jgi:hypothetical protein
LNFHIYTKGNRGKMDINLLGKQSPVLFIPHGVGPLPLLGDEDPGTD